MMRSAVLITLAVLFAAIWAFDAFEYASPSEVFRPQSGAIRSPSSSPAAWGTLLDC